MTDLLALIPELIQPARALVELAGTAGVQPRVTSTLRTHAEQERLYRRFQQGLNPYPVAPPGSSAHEYGYAFDMVVSGEENQTDLGTVWQQWGGKWGGRGDPVHFEYPGFSLSNHLTPPETATSTEGSGASARATVMDFLLGFVPGVGSVELAATVAELLGLDHSTVMDFLSSPISTAEKYFPGLIAFITSMPPFGLLPAR